MSNNQWPKIKRFEFLNLGFENCLYLVSCILFLSLLSCASNEAKANEVCLRDTCYTVELAIKQEEQSKGLMYRESMPADHGMLFVFPVAMRQSFWMKNTKIPLDMIWLDYSRRIVYMEKAAQPCTADPCRQYTPSAQALYVLELNAGETEKGAMKIGDQWEFKLDLKDQ